LVHETLVDVSNLGLSEALRQSE